MKHVCEIKLKRIQFQINYLHFRLNIWKFFDMNENKIFFLLKKIKNTYTEYNTYTEMPITHMTGTNNITKIKTTSIAIFLF